LKKKEEREKQQACRTNGRRKYPTEFVGVAGKEEKNENARVIVLFHSVRVYLCVFEAYVVLKKIEDEDEEKKK